jgi:CubicO group peptidase (beta-lactamase class C family)
VRDAFEHRWTTLNEGKSMNHSRVIAAVLSALLAAVTPNIAVSKPATASGAASVARIDKQRIDDAIGTLVKSGALVGASALVYQDGREAYFGAFGLADREANRPMARDTLAQIWSMTKPITGVALMTLYDQGKFQLDDPVSKYLPEFANVRVYAGKDVEGEPILQAPHRAITIRDLLRHTSGMYGSADTGPVSEMFRKADTDDFNITLAEKSRRLATVPLLYQPGTRWLYSPAPDVEARLVEVLSGQPFDKYLQQNLFGPLKMKDTRHGVADWKRMAALYTRTDDGVMTRQPDDDAFKLVGKDWPFKSGSWGVTSTLDDYMRFARMLLNGGELDGVRILKPSTVRLMSSDAMPDEVTDTSWLPSKGQVGFGINLAVRIARPKTAAEASGEVGEFFWDGGANTLFWVDPINRITAVLFAQYVPFGRVPLHKAFRDAVYRDDSSAAAPVE